MAGVPPGQRAGPPARRRGAVRRRAGALPANQLAEHQRRLVALFQSATHGANALEIANERYRAGAGSYLAVLENQRALYQIREELAQAETASFVNVIALYKALGWGSGDLAPGAGQLAAGETAGANR